MAARGGSASKGGPPRKGSRASPARSAAKRGNPGNAKGTKPAAAAKRTPQAAMPPVPPPKGPFRLGVIPGATPGKWVDTWKQRMPRVDLLLVPLEVADQRSALASGLVDAAIVRLPIDQDGLHTIPLYDEVTVVVCAADSHLTAADELSSDDLAGEVLITPVDDVLGIGIEGAARPRFDPPETTADAIATVAAGVGIVIVPMSLARLHHRKDVEFRPLVGAPLSAVALAWPVEATTELVDAFVGIVRGRTANSSR